ncbi:MAG: phage holin family protein [Methylibium sp.]|nr:phage holin family protein [Methylibium sp.]
MDSMRMLLIHVALCLYLMAPLHASAVEAVVKNPLDYSLKQYAFILIMSLFGGMAAWYGKVKRGELSAASLSSLVGELTTSALAGMLAFFVCEWLNIAPILTAAVVGVVGHMGARGIALGESWLQRKVDGDRPPDQT